MKRLLNWDMPESIMSHGQAWNPKRKNPSESVGVVTRRAARPNGSGANLCAKCGNEVKVFVSPKRNPHSNKLGRAVSMKDHDLCRRCWRKLMHQQRNMGVVTLPLSLFLGGKILHPRLLVPLSYSVPREAS
jgi:ribosomal protein S14